MFTSQCEMFVLVEILNYLRDFSDTPKALQKHFDTHAREHSLNIEHIAVRRPVVHQNNVDDDPEEDITTYIVIKEGNLGICVIFKTVLIVL